MKLLLVDGHYYLYRSFFAIGELSNSRGEPTNAIYGFIRALRKMLVDIKPDLAVVVWDEGLPERRTTLQPEYKQHREEMPNELQAQQAPLRLLVSQFGITNVSAPNTEADDLIASYVTDALTKKIKCVIATNDKDIMQLVSDDVVIYSVAKADLTKADATIADKPQLAQQAKENYSYALLGVAEVKEKWGVSPPQLLDLLALTGDAADNIRGLTGVGKKTAATWLQRYGSLEELLSARDLPLKIKEKVESSCQQLRQNRLMIELDRDLPLPVPLENCEIVPDYPSLISTLQQLEFRSLATELEKEAQRLGIDTKSILPL
ncbi:MAG: hypothetical protein K2W99_07215 [Chthoniobacterales bacterium]|nr:hypothetical protein [Chthoniobacterales bacterium]